MATTIYHNPDCSASRNCLAVIREAGVEPRIVEYLREPFSRDRLLELIDAAGLAVRDVLRKKGALYLELGLGDPGLSEDQLLDAMLGNPSLIERPFVETPLGARLCRPAELVLDILPRPATTEGRTWKT